MASRPVFIPVTDGERLVQEQSFDFKWNPGFAPIQKKKNISALHEAAASDGYKPLLEVSTKSEDVLGQQLSAFNLCVETDGGQIPLECAFQGSKVFEGGVQYSDLYGTDGRTARKDSRLRKSGSLECFNFEGIKFPLEPRTGFYDWLYIRSLCPQAAELGENLKMYAGFTDIEFNPAKSINCQARSCATFVALLRKNILHDAMRDADTFLDTLRPDSRQQPHSRDGELFPK